MWQRSLQGDSIGSEAEKAAVAEGKNLEKAVEKAEKKLEGK